MQKKGFTLIEIILVLSWFVIIIGVVFGLYQGLFSIKNNISSKQLVIEQTYYTMERIQVLLQDFTIDYEEYRNRQLVWCNSDDPIRDVWTWWYCQRFTQYGNANSLNNFDASEHQLYYCSGLANQMNPPVIYNNDMSSGQWCFDPIASNPPYYQSFWQYKEQFWDRGGDTSGDGNIVGDDDDEDIGVGPFAFVDTGVQEIYLISPDQTQRLFIRRTLVDSGDVNNDGIIQKEEMRYTLQILRLQWLDAGSEHNFAPGDNTIYDGQIDTRACDAAQWFFCQGEEVSGWYSWFHLPLDEHDGRVDLLDDRITVSDRSVQIYPTSNPAYAWAQEDIQMQPYIRIAMDVQLYAWWWKNNLGTDISDFSFPIQTTFNIRTWYTK